MTFTPTPPSTFRPGLALRSAFEAVFAQFGLFAGLAVVIYAVPSLLLILPFGSREGTPLTLTALALARGVGSLVLGSVLQGALVIGVLDHLSGRRPSFLRCLRGGIGMALPLIAVGLLGGTGIAFGVVLLIAPGLFLVSLWAVVAPVVVIERRGVLGAFSRSAELTEGHRWAVLGAMMTMFTIALVVGVVGAILIGTVTAMTDGLTGVRGSYSFNFLLVTLGDAITGALSNLLTSTLPAALYFHLRRAREGADPAQLAAVFD